MQIKQLISNLLIFLPIFLIAQKNIQQQENQYYSIKSVPIPKEVILEVGGLAFDDEGNLGVTTRRGELWSIKNPSSSTPTSCIRLARTIGTWI